MNQTRRKELEKLRDNLNDIRELIEQQKDAEDDYREYMPENMQQGEKHDQSETFSDKMEEAMDDIDNAISALEEIFN